MGSRLLLWFMGCMQQHCTEGDLLTMARMNNHGSSRVLQQHCMLINDQMIVSIVAYFSASRGRSSSRGKKAPSSAFRPPLSLGCSSTAVKSLVAAAKASS